MRKQHPRLHPPVMWLLGLLVLGLPLVAACGGAPEPAAAPPTAAETETAAVETPVEQATAPQAVAETEEAKMAAENEPQTAAEPTEENPPAQASTALAECQTMDIPDNSLIAAVSEADWAKGPANAPVTLIEYGDYQ